MDKKNELTEDKRPLLARAFIERAEGGKEGEEKQMRVSVSSATPCYNVVRTKRGYAIGMVTLSHDEGAIDDTWIAGGIVLRKNHGGEVVARGMDCKIEDGRLVANKILWGASEAAQIIKADAENGVIREMSIEADYSAEDVEETDEDSFVIRHWTPLAAAFVAVPADPTVGINRELFRASVAQKVDTSAEIPKPDKEEAGNKATTTERAHPMDKTKTEGDALVKPVATVQVTDNSAEITREEMEQFSILRAIRAVVERNPDLAPIERGISAKLQKQMGKAPQGFFIPSEVFRRAFSTAASNGSGLVGTDHMASEYIAALRDKLVLSQLGIRYMPGLRNNVDIPKQTAATSAYWVAEGVAPEESNPQVGQILMAPHTVGGVTEITRRLLEQGSPEAAQLVQDDIALAIALKIQDAAFSGDGNNGKPLGILNTIGINEATISVPGSPTWAEICNFAGEIDQYFVVGGKWVLNNKSFSALRGTKRFPATGGGDATMAEINAGQKYVADELAYTTGQLAAGTAIYGDFSNLVIGMWSALDILVDPYTLSNKGSIRITGLQDVDIAVRHPEAFVVTDDFPGAA